MMTALVWIEAGAVADNSEVGALIEVLIRGPEVATPEAVTLVKIVPLVAGLFVVRLGRI